jgi:hypothetical protein
MVPIAGHPALLLLLALIHRFAWKRRFREVAPCIASVQSPKPGGWLEIPATPGLKVCGFCHGERRREARKKVAVVLAIGHTLRAHQALGRPDALPCFLEVVYRFFEKGVFVDHDKSIRIGILRSPYWFTFPREHEDIVDGVTAGKHRVEVEDFDFSYGFFAESIRVASFAEGLIGYREWARRNGRLGDIHSIDDRFDHDVDEIMA